MTDVEIPAEIVDEGAEGAISVWLFRDGETVSRATCWPKS